jgi:hypothetical protein
LPTAEAAKAIRSDVTPAPEAPTGSLPCVRFDPAYAVFELAASFQLTLVLRTVKFCAKAIMQNVSVRTGKGAVDYIDGFLDQMMKTSK